jgi:hypothetical protein
LLFGVKMKSLFPVLLLLFLLSSYSSAQKSLLMGKIIDRQSMLPLSFANIRVDGTSQGTSANIQGNFQIRLSSGPHRIITSYMGFKSDTLEININQNMFVSIELSKVTINLPEVTVLPGTNPAIALMRKVIEAKKKREEKLNSYIFSAYTKGLLKTTQDLSASSNSITLSLDGFGPDTAELKITGILENESKGYFYKPDYYKEEIIARKQSSNTPPTINLLTGGRIVQNFYRDDIRFFDKPLLSPVADDALDYYYYYIEDTLAMDNMNVFKIYFEPNEISDPGFFGRLYIADSIFSLVKLNIYINDAANPGGIFTRVNVLQQFLPYDEDIYMPIDYRLFVEGNYLGIAKFGFEMNSIFYDYEINSNLDEDYFDMAVITVMPDADEKDSSYWISAQSIPNTLEEIKAYERIDSVESVPLTFWDRFAWFSSSTQLSDNVSITGPLGLYHFNRVEGNALNFDLDIYQLAKKRFNANVNIGYGFADKKFKSELYADYYLGKYRTYKLSIKAYNKITDLFGETISYNQLTSTFFNLISKYDFRDYFYTKGFEFKAKSEVFPVLQLETGIVSRYDKSAQVNSDFSILNRSKIYRSVLPIYESKINALSLGFKIDFRKYIEDGYFRRRIQRENTSPIITGEIVISDKKKLNSYLDFTVYKAGLTGGLPLFSSTHIDYNIRGVYSSGPVPFQMLYALPGNIESAGKNFTFRTLEIGDAYGDKVVTFGIQHDIRDELFRFLNIPILKDLQIQLGAHFNMAWLEISGASCLIVPVMPKNIFRSPFMELGFSIGHILVPLKLEFTWKLNHLGKNNFVFGFNTLAL